MAYKYDLFISHSTKNKDIADYLVKKIEERGYKCFIAPRDINPASEYPVELENGIIKSLAFLLIFSHDADVSRHVRTEIDIAFSINKTIIPFRIENILPSKSLAYYLRLPQWLDAFPQILDVHLEEIIKKIKALKDVETAEDQEQNFKIVGPQLLNSEDISELGLDYKSLLMKKIEIANICVPTADIEKYSEKLHHLQQNFEVENSVLLIKNDEMVGYCDLCPVTKDSYNELVTGETLLQENMLDVYVIGDTIDICIPMLAILPAHTKLDNYWLIFEWIFQKFLSWYENEITVNRICISVYSPILDKIVRKFGFIEQSLNPIKGKIYSTSLAKLKENKSVGKGKKYKKFFESIIVPEETKINVNNNANSKISEEKNFALKPSEDNETVTKIPNDKESASAPPNAITPEPKLDTQPITIAPSKIINENISSENPSPLEITEKVQENESSLSVIKTSSTTQLDSVNTASYPTSSDISKVISQNETIPDDKEKPKSEITTNPTTKIQSIHTESPQTNQEDLIALFRRFKNPLELSTETDTTSPQSLPVPQKDAGILIPSEKNIHRHPRKESADVHYDFYVSYAYKNLYVADYLVEKIEERGYKCFIAHRDTKATHSDITTARLNSSAILFILSSDSNLSHAINMDIWLSFLRNKPIVTLQTEYVILSEELKSYLGNIPIIYAYPKILDTHIDAIIETFNTLKNTTYSYPNTKTTIFLSTYLGFLRTSYEFKYNVYISGQSKKADKKIRNAEKAYADLQEGETSLLCLDNTIFGAADRGILATTRGIYVKNIGVKLFYTYDNFPNLIILSAYSGYYRILLGLEMEYGIGVSSDFKDTFLFIDLLNRVQNDFNPHQTNLKFIAWELLISDFTKSHKNLFLSSNDKVILYSFYAEENNSFFQSIQNGIKISQSEQILIFGNLAKLEHNEIISYVCKLKIETLPPCAFLATTKGLYVNNKSKYTNVFIGYNEIHSFTTVLKEYKDAPNCAEIFVYCSEKKYCTLDTQLDKNSCFYVVELLNKLRANFIVEKKQL